MMIQFRFHRLRSALLSRRRRSRSAPLPPLCARDEPAYVVLETARLRCERALEHKPGEKWLRALHREVGLAGYYASERIPSLRRRELLELARRRARDGVREDELAALAELAQQAARAVEDGLLVPELSDHMQRARERLAQAQLMLAPRGAATSTASSVGSPASSSRQSQATSS
jgi:DNA-binding XRE family transcriptional regulator